MLIPSVCLQSTLRHRGSRLKQRVPESSTTQDSVVVMVVTHPETQLSWTARSAGSEDHEPGEVAEWSTKSPGAILDSRRAGPEHSEG